MKSGSGGVPGYTCYFVHTFKTRELARHLKNIVFSFPTLYTLVGYLSGYPTKKINSLQDEPR